MQTVEESQPLPAPSLIQDSVHLDPVDTAGSMSNSEMARSIQIWGVWWIILGVMSAIPSLSFSPAGAVVLIFIGLSSFIFQTATMYAVFATSIGLAAVFNIISGEAGWGVFALLQIYMSVRTFRDFRRYRSIDIESVDISGQSVPSIYPWNDPSRLFPWLTLGAGLIATFALISAFGVFVIDFFAIPEEGTLSAGAENTIYVLFIALSAAGELGISYGLASILSKYRPRIVTVLGISAAFISLSAYFLLTLWASG